MQHFCSVDKAQSSQKGNSEGAIAVGPLEAVIDLVIRLLMGSLSAVEQDIALLLSHGSQSSGTQQLLPRLSLYRRKIDVEHAVMSEYDWTLNKATSDVSISSHGYLGLALVLIELATREPCMVQESRAKVLRLTNSALNCLDLVKTSDAAQLLEQVSPVLGALLLKGAAL